MMLYIGAEDAGDSSRYSLDLFCLPVVTTQNMESSFAQALSEELRLLVALIFVLVSSFLLVNLVKGFRIVDESYVHTIDIRVIQKT